MTQSRTEYRINKKGSECFRTTDGQAAYAKLKELSDKRPGIYAIQIRICKLDRYGIMERDCSGHPLWSAWH